VSHAVDERPLLDDRLAPSATPLPSDGGAELDLDAVQQRLFAIALGLRSLRSTAADPADAARLEDLEGAIDELIKDVRRRALGDRDTSVHR
jgi:hypothetical protein